MHTPTKTLNAASAWLTNNLETLHGPQAQWTRAQRSEHEVLGQFLLLFLLEVPLTLIPAPNAGAVAPPPQMPDSTNDVPGGCPPASC
jgi:hypothetical protein